MVFSDHAQGPESLRIGTTGREAGLTGAVAADPSVDQLQVEATHDGVRLVLKLSGSAELRDNTALAKVLLHYDQQAQLAGTEHIDVDLRAVEFMNSTALGAFVHWFAAMKDRDAHFQVCLLSDPRKHWQCGTLQALASFAVGHVTVEPLAVVALPGPHR